MSTLFLGHRFTHSDNSDFQPEKNIFAPKTILNWRTAVLMEKKWCVQMLFKDELMHHGGKTLKLCLLSWHYFILEVQSHRDLSFLPKTTFSPPTRSPSFPAQQTEGGCWQTLPLSAKLLPVSRNLFPVGRYHNSAKSIPQEFITYHLMAVSRTSRTFCLHRVCDLFSF